MHLTIRDREEILSQGVYIRARERLGREPMSEDLQEQWMAEREVQKKKTLQAIHDLKIHAPFPGEKSHSGERQ